MLPAGKGLPKGSTLAMTATGIYSDDTQKPLSGSAISWEVAPSSIATVNKQGRVTALQEGLAKVTASYQGVSGDALVIVGGPVLSGISVAALHPTLPVGESEPLIATGIYTDGSTQILSNVAWQVSPPGAATVSMTGELRALEQTVVIVKAFYNAFSTETSVTIGPAALTSIALNAPQTTLPLGETESLVATATFSDGSTQNWTQIADWSVSPPTVAQIDAHGNLKATAQGAIEILATSQGFVGRALVAVGPAALLNISVVAPEASLPLGESEVLVPVGTFSDGTKQNIGAAVIWNSSNPAVAAVDATGTVKGSTEGTVVISVAEGSLGANTSLIVSAPVMVGLNVSPASNSLVIGGKTQIRAIAKFSDGSDQDVTNSAKWTSESPSLAVSSSGLISAAHTGTATIQAAKNTFTGTASVTVTPLMMTSYFNLANPVAAGYDSTVWITDSGFTPGDICAMVYVFDRDQEMNACCGCKVSDSGLLSLSLVNDLTANTLTGKKPVAGTIEIVPADLGAIGVCNAGSPSPDGMMSAWNTNVQVSGTSYEVTEVPMATTSLSSSEAHVLETECSMIQELGSGAGVCTCGTGN